MRGGTLRRSWGNRTGAIAQKERASGEDEEIGRAYGFYRRAKTPPRSAPIAASTAMPT
jgi:hypothetical protein